MVAASATAFTALKLVGAAYVVYLGIQAIRHRGGARAALDLPVHDRPATAWASVRTAMAVGVTNPKTTVFFAAFLPQFVDADHAASRARTWFAREPKRLDHLGVVGGVMMVGLGATLATSSS
ncbi:MAG: LysE family transporter [Nocardioides sp.]|nr:LysE family transporter [Nocardioides sp.]